MCNNRAKSALSVALTLSGIGESCAKYPKVVTALLLYNAIVTLSGACDAAIAHVLEAHFAMANFHCCTPASGPKKQPR